MITLFTTDKKFFDSPDTGWPECTCSRCGNMITEREMPLRMFDAEDNSEYRYCEPCQERDMGIKYNHDDYGFNDDHLNYPTQA